MLIIIACYIYIYIERERERCINSKDMVSEGLSTAAAGRERRGVPAAYEYT